MARWGSPVEIERRRRILVAAWAWAYEVDDAPLVDDATFDRACMAVDPSIETGHPSLDAFFRDQFDRHTGQWVRSHPDPDGLRRLVGRIRAWRTQPDGQMQLL